MFVLLSYFFWFASADYPFGILFINIIIGLFYFWLQSIHGNNISKIVIMMFTTGHQKELYLPVKEQ